MERILQYSGSNFEKGGLSRIVYIWGNIYILRVFFLTMFFPRIVLSPMLRKTSETKEGIFISRVNIKTGSAGDWNFTESREKSSVIINIKLFISMPITHLN